LVDTRLMADFGSADVEVTAVRSGLW
jgi:hypothetical protein